MVEKKYCWNQCDTTKNISTDDQRNPSCYGGMGWCLPYDDTDTSKGVCVFPVANIRTKNQKCLHGVPFEDSWHACESDYTCVKVSQYSNDAFCWNNCDVNKTGAFGLNPDCDSGQGKCVELISVSGQTPVGACEPLREKKNAKDAKCNTGYDPSKPEYFDCAAGLTCHYSKCAEERKPVCNELDQCEGSSPTAADWCKCKPGFICLNHTCAKERTLTQKEGQRCDTLNFGKPDYNSCEAGLKCIKNSCLKTCDPTLTPPACGKEQICQKLAGGAANAGVCQNISLLTCKRDPSDVNKSDCPANFYCFKFNWSYNCVKSCDPSSTAPGCVQDYTCRPFDINDAKKGYCIPDRLNNYNRLNDTCHSSDPLDLDYHGCEPPYECVSSNCREPLPKTQGQGEVCDTSSKGCQAGLICLLPGRDYTAQDICMKQCNPYQSGQCDSGEVCQVEQENKFYWSAGCYKERKEILDNGSQCKCTDPTKPCYDLCKPNLTCHKYVDEYSTCVVECDPAQNDVNTGLNSVCQTDETCDKYKNCLKLINSTQPTGQQCKMKDPRLPTYHDCQTGNYCVEFGDSSNPDNWCHQTCDPINPQCSAGYVCANAETDEYCANDADCAVGQKCLLGEDSYYKVCHVNICQKIRQNTQKEFQKCQTTDSTKPEYNDCEAGFVCSGYQYKSTKDKYCLKKCQVGGTGCATGFACSSFSYSGDNVCIQSCTQKAECINYGSECERAYGSQYVCH